MKKVALLASVFLVGIIAISSPANAVTAGQFCGKEDHNATRDSLICSKDENGDSWRWRSATPAPITPVGYTVCVASGGKMVYWKTDCDDSELGPFTWNQVGPTGAQGVAGIKGDPGIAGAVGPMGVAGARGAAGPVCPTGTTVRSRWVSVKTTKHGSAEWVKAKLCL